MNTAIQFLALSLLVAAAGCSSPTREVSLNTVSFPDTSLPPAASKRPGTLSIQVTDTRPEKPTVGKMSGRIGANAIFVVSGGLEARLTPALPFHYRGGSTCSIRIGISPNSTYR